MKRSKRLLLPIAIVNFLFVIALTAFSAFSLNTVKAEETADIVKVAEELTWEGTPTCGWTLDGTNLVQKNVDVATGAAIVVNGVTYTENTIGTHLPATNIDQDIVYDISSYSGQYEYFQVMVAQPDGGANNPLFTVLVDGVAKGYSFWNSAAVSEPAIIRVNVSGASTLTLRLNLSSPEAWFGFGQSAWINPILYNIDTDVRTWATDLPEIMTTSDVGYDSGLGNRIVLDARGNGNPISYWGGSVSYDKGLGVHLKNIAYDVYEADKTNTANYISAKWDITGKNFTYFNSVFYMAFGSGYHIDVWIDGVETQTSGLIESIASAAYKGIWEANAGYVLNVDIPVGATEIEIRIIADTVYNDGLVEFCNPAFYTDSNYLISKFAEEVRAPEWPHAVARGFLWNGAQATIRDSLTDSVLTIDRGMFGILGSEYTYDIANSNYNFFKSQVGLTGEFLNGEITFNARVTYADETYVDYSSEVVNYNNSNIDFSFGYDNTDAVSLTLFVTGNLPDSNYVWSDTLLADKIVYSYVNGEDTTYQYYDVDDQVVEPDLGEFVGYTVEYLKDSVAVDFANETATEDTVITVNLNPNVYTLSVYDKFDDSAAVLNGAYSLTHTYGTATVLPTPTDVVGYTFLGWKYNDSWLTSIAEEQITSDISVTAIFTIKLYDVTFIDGINETTISVAHGDEVTAPDPVGFGNMIFDGWYLDSTYTTEFDDNAAITENMSVYAKYIEDQSTVTTTEETTTEQTTEAATTVEDTTTTEGATTTQTNTSVETTTEAPIDLGGSGCSSCSEVSPSLIVGSLLVLFGFFIYRRKF